MGLVCAISVVFASGSPTSAMPPRDQAGTPDWPGFRGADHQAHVSETYPVFWDIASENNISWAVPTTGLGHSSPVIKDNRVFITAVATSRNASRRFGLLTVLQSALASALAVAVTAWAHRHTISSAEHRHSHSGDLIRMVIALACTAIAIFICLFGTKVFDYDRCPIRSWLGSMTMTGLVLDTLACITYRCRAARHVLLVTITGTSCITFLAMPAKDHVFRVGLLGDQVLVSLVVALAPALVLAIVFATRAFDDEDQRRAFESRTAIGVMLLLIVVFLGISLLHHIRSAILPLGDDLPAQQAPFIALAPTTITALVAVLLAFATHPRLRPRKEDGGPADPDRGPRSRRDAVVFLNRVAPAIFVFSLTALALATIVIVLTMSIQNSSFLQYHLPTPDWRSATAFQPTLIATAGVSAIATFLIVSRTGSTTARVPSPVFLTFATALGLVPSHLYAANAKWNRRAPDYVRVVDAYDVRSGAKLWSWEGFSGPLEPAHRENTSATPTPVASDHHVVAFFGNSGLVCLDSDTGNVEWMRTDIGFRSVYGAGGSPVAIDGRLFVVCDEATDGRIHAIDLANGRTLWERTRGPARPGQPVVSAHSRTPFIQENGDRFVLLAWGWDEVTAYDAATGDVVRVIGIDGGGDHVASIAADRERLYFTTPQHTLAYPASFLVADEPTPLWKARATANCSTPVSNGAHVISVTDHGIVTSLDAITGRVEWRARLPGEFRASPVIAGDHVYIAGTTGVVHVGRLTDSAPQFVTFDMLDPIFATLAAAESRLVLRTQTTMYCIGQAVTSGEETARHSMGIPFDATRHRGKDVR